MKIFLSLVSPSKSKSLFLYLTYETGVTLIGIRDRCGWHTPYYERCPNNLTNELTLFNFGDEE